jgi:radical SAM protein with 4Fe4S-binding SPASM domain
MNLLPSSVREHIHEACKRAECKEHRLMYLFLEITRRCNLACRHCGSDCGSSDGNHRSLTTASWEKLIADLAETFTPTPTIVLTGGEPVLHPDLQRILTALNQHRFRWGMVSNGYALDRSTLDLLLRKRIYSITLSLDGTERSHNRLRGKPDAYRRTVAALRLLVGQGIPEMDVVTCVNPMNQHELDSIAEDLIGIGVRSWRLFRIFPAGRAQGNRSLLLSPSETGRLIDWIAKNRQGYARRGLEVSYGCEGWLPFSVDRRIRTQPFFCRAGINIASILTDGTITGCTNNADRFFEGNVLENSFAYVWRNGFRQFRNRSWVEATECGACLHQKRCRGSSIHLWRDNPARPEFCYMDCYADRYANP